MNEELKRQVAELVESGRAADAEAGAREWVAREPESPEGFFYLAHALHALGRPEEALVVSDEVLARRPDNPVAHSQRSALLLALGRIPDAVSAAETAIRLDPANPSGYWRLADVLLKADRFRELTALLADALARFPDNADILFRAGLFAFQQDRIADLDALARAGHALDATDSRFQFLAGLAAAGKAREKAGDDRERQERYQEADRLLAEAAELGPGLAVYRTRRLRNASDSRDDAVNALLVWWLLGALAAGFLLPLVFALPRTPWWLWVPTTLLVWGVGILFSARCPEFNLVLPMWRKEVVTVPLLPQEWGKGIALWAVFLALTLSVLLLPPLFFGR